MRLVNLPFRFPNECKIRFILAPGGPFGTEDLSGRLQLKGVPYEAEIQRNTGRLIHKKPQRMEAISVSSVLNDASVRAEGNIVIVNGAFKSEDELLDLIETVNYALPVAMSLQFFDAPVVAAVTGKVGKVGFIWAYRRYPTTTDVTTKERQEQSFLESWERLKLLVPAENRRLFAALNYFHVACRLALVGTSPWEFTGEIIVNLAKVLDVLFPDPPPQTVEQAKAELESCPEKQRKPGLKEKAKAGLDGLGYSPNDIDKWFLPVIDLRNRVDAGHVNLADLNQEQLNQIHKYTSHVEKAFRHLLELVTKRVSDGTLKLPSYKLRDKEIERIVRRLAEHNYSKLDLESFSDQADPQSG